MRALKPEIEEITKKFPDKKDAMKKQSATMALYKQAGVNPMAGCIPMALQFPILIALFRFFPSAFELRQQSFLWATDLSSYDSIWDLGFEIPFYGDHVSLFTLLMTVSTLIYTKMNQDSELVVWRGCGYLHLLRPLYRLVCFSARLLPRGTQMT